MKSPNDIERRIVNTRIEPRSEMRSKVLSDALKAQAALKDRTHADISFKRWRIVMKSRTIRYAAAAVILIAVLVGINHLGGSIDGTSMAWSQVIEQMNSYTRYKCRQRVVREKGPQHPTMQVYHLNLSQRRQEVEDGSIHVIDMRSKDPITVELYPAEKKATVTTLIGFGPKKDPNIIAMVKRFEQESTERLGTKKLAGKILQGFRHLPNEHNDFTVWVDPETKLPVEIELKHVKRGQTIFLDDFEFDFELDPSAFSTEVPEGYEVKTITQDYRPVESKEITPEDIRSGLDHSAYTVEKRPWMKSIFSVQALNPLSRSGTVFLVGILSQDENTMVISQSKMYGDYRDAMMEWIRKEELVMELSDGTKVYTHPNGSESARLHLESFAKSDPKFYSLQDISDERVARMIVLPNGTIMGLSANHEMTDQQLKELVESLTEIKGN
jgi:hypothetical protein